MNSTVEIPLLGESNNFQNLSMDIQGLFLGRTTLFFNLELKSNKTSFSLNPNSLAVVVLRHTSSAKLTRIFTIVLAILVFSNNIIMGMQLDWRIILGVLKRPIAPAIGFVCQFGCMPLLATAWSMLLLPGKPALQFGYFAVGCSPGGGPSNMWSLLLDGSLDLSITMTFISNIAALGMMPFWLFTLGQMFYKQAAPGNQITIPFKDILISLVLLICPIFFGIFIKYFKPAIAEKSRKIVKFSTFIVALILIPFGIYANLYVFSLMTWRTLVCGFCLPWSGFTIGFLAAWVFRQDFCYRKGSFINYVTQTGNAAIAMLIMNFSLPKPDGDLALVMPFCVLIFTPLPMFISLIAKIVVNKIKNRRENSKTAKVKVKEAETELLEAKNTNADM